MHFPCFLHDDGDDDDERLINKYFSVYVDVSSSYNGAYIAQRDVHVYEK